MSLQRFNVENVSRNRTEKKSEWISRTMNVQKTCVPVFIVEVSEDLGEGGSFREELLQLSCSNSRRVRQLSDIIFKSFSVRTYPRPSFSHRIDVSTRPPSNGRRDGGTIQPSLKMYLVKRRREIYIYFFPVFDVKRRPEQVCPKNRAHSLLHDICPGQMEDEVSGQH